MTKAEELEAERQALRAAAEKWAKDHDCPQWLAFRWMNADLDAWEGRARMAKVREEEWIPLDRIDEIALEGSWR